MSILRNVKTPSCTTHRDCLEAAEVGIACYLENEQRQPVRRDYSTYREDTYTPEEGVFIAREIESKPARVYAEKTLFHACGFKGPIRMSDYERARIEEDESYTPSGWDYECAECVAQTEILTYESYVGRVVAKRSQRHQAHWDSGFPDWNTYHATVYAVDGTWHEVSAETDGDITIDAPPQLMAMHAAHVAAVEKANVEARARAERAAAQARAAEEAATPRKGRMVRVVRGRKVPKGTEGIVTWYGEGKSYAPNYYGRSYRDQPRGPMRVGIKTASGEVVYTAASNVEVIQPMTMDQAAE